jgi:hypothetical protein
MSSLSILPLPDHAGVFTANNRTTIDSNFQTIDAAIGGAGSPTGTGSIVLSESPSIANPLIAGFMQQTAVNNIQAGGTPGTRPPGTFTLTAVINNVTSPIGGGPNLGVTLPDALIGRIVFVFVGAIAAPPISIYGGGTSDTIDGQASVSADAGSRWLFVAIANNTWLSCALAAA